MAVAAVDEAELCLRDIFGEKILLGGREKFVGRDADDEGRRSNFCQCRRRTAAPAPDVVRVHGLADGVVGEGGKAFAQLFALVSLVAADFEVVDAFFGIIGLCAVVSRIISVRQHRHGAGGFQSFLSRRFGFRVEGRVGFECHALGFVVGDAPGGVLGIGSHDDDLLGEVRLHNCPFQNLLPAHRAADE